MHKNKCVIAFQMGLIACESKNPCNMHSDQAGSGRNSGTSNNLSHTWSPGVPILDDGHGRSVERLPRHRQMPTGRLRRHPLH